MIETPGALYDALHKRFGVGDYDEAVSRKEWWQVRNVEVSKIKAMLKKRKVDLADVVLAYEYVVETGRFVTASWQLFDLIPDARRHARQAELAAETTVRERLNAAAGEAMEQGETIWAARLYNASESAGDDMLQQWLDERSTT